MLKMIIILLIAGLVFLCVLQNLHQVRLRLLLGDFQINVVFLVLLTFGIGFFSAFMIRVFGKKKASSRKKRGFGDREYDIDSEEL